MIIDDEEPARRLVQKYVAEFENIEVIGTASNGLDAVRGINELQPDIVIIDIRMPKLDGFEVIELVEHKPFVIFSTAFDNYAVKAFENNAVDYILKPFSKERLFSGLRRAIEALDLRQVVKSTDDALEEFHSEKKIERIAVKSGSRIIVIPISEVQYIAAEGDYVSVINLAGESYLKEKTMKYFEAVLPESEFARIHRSYIVNINQILKIENKDKDYHEVILKSGKAIKSSMTGYRNLKNVLGL